MPTADWNAALETGGAAVSAMRALRKSEMVQTIGEAAVLFAVRDAELGDRIAGAKDAPPAGGEAAAEGT